MNRPLVMAHRGASALLPENSPAAFQRAIADGADILETDLHFTRDDELVVIHDSTLDRTVEGSGQIQELTLAEIKQLKLRQPAERREVVEKVLTLRELIELTGETTPLALELKSPLFEQSRYAKMLVDLLREYHMLEECAVISFNMATIEAVKKVEPALAGGWITMSNPLPTQPTELLGPAWPLVLLNPFYIKWAHRMGKIVAPLDTAPESRMGLYLKLNADVILCDNPESTLDAIKAVQRK